MVVSGMMLIETREKFKIMEITGSPVGRMIPQFMP